MTTQLNSITLSTLSALTKFWYVQIALLAFVIVVTYGHTLDVPFYLDDFSSIQENPTIYQWNGTFAELWQFSPLRVIGYLTFALNFQLHKFQYPGYHLVNIFIHFLVSCAILGLLRGLVRTPQLENHLSETAKRWLPFFVALLFALHPLQTQAVTYIVQRLASLAALFYIASLACFIQLRLNTTFITWLTTIIQTCLMRFTGDPDVKTPTIPNFTTETLQGILWTVACLICALLGFFTKQNTFTLPLALLLLEICFFSKNWKQILLACASVFGSLTVIWIIFASVLNKNPFSLEAMQALTQETTTISRDSYLATQFSVLWTYIRLFFLPIDLQIDYNYPLTSSIGQAKALFALTGHLTVFGAAFYLLRRVPLVAFGILFYYLTHAIESSVIPISDVVFEHRTYLPNLGLCILCIALLFNYLLPWIETWVSEDNRLRTMFSDAVPQTMESDATIAAKPVYYVILIILLILSLMTWQRNQLWRNPIALWQDNLEKSPGKKRAWVILGKHLIQADRPEEGIMALERSAELKKNPDGSQSLSLTPEAVLNMVVAFKMQQKYDKALNWINQSLSNAELRPFDRSKFLVNQGNVFYEQNRLVEAEKAYRQAISFYPQSLSARANLASILAATGRKTEAEALYLEILAIDPHNQIVKENLMRLQKGFFNK